MRRLAAVLVLLAMPAAAWAQDPALVAKAQHLMALTETNAITEQAVQQSVKAVAGVLKQKNPAQADAVDAFVTEHFMPEFQRHAPEIASDIAAIYALNFTGEELDGLIAFYETPLGKKMIQKLPQLIQQSIVVGQSWGERVGREAIEKLMPKLREKGLNL